MIIYLKILLKIVLFFLLITLFFSCVTDNTQKNERQQVQIKEMNPEFIDYFVNPKVSIIEFYWKNELGEPYRNFICLDSCLRMRGRHLIFAMNGGIFDKDSTPCGLYIENEKELKMINKQNGTGNFYLKPNGIFYLTKSNIPKICETSELNTFDTIKYAIQSGPLLIHKGKICNSFQTFRIKFIRNAVGILADSRIVLTISKLEVTINELAQHLHELGCTDALYLDGAISDYYLNGSENQYKSGFFTTFIGVIK